MLVEKFTGHKVKIIEGDYKNIKITTPDDLEIAEYYRIARVACNEAIRGSSWGPK